MKLKIELRSDLCAAVGKHYAAMIDLDTALDENGIPFIPARRLKGCLREVASFCSDEDTVNRIFGVSGNGKSGTLSLGNAYVEDYDCFKDEIRQKGIPAEKVTELFCSVRGETAIESDTAKKETLRFIRVVNMTSPVTEKPLVFYADMDIGADDKALVEKYAGALRNIGYHRNRGLGLVKCSVEDGKLSSAVCPNYEENFDTLRITVRLDGDMMLPDTDAGHSGDRITGTMLLGAVAAKYVKKHGDDGFNALFYSDVTFGDLTPAVPSYENRKNVPCFDYTFPAPRYLAKIKAAKEDERGIHNVIGKEGDGKQYKPLKKGYVSKRFGLVTPQTKIVYHNANINSDESSLYMQYCLSAGQYFSGTVCGPAEKIKTIAELFYDGNGMFNDKLRFGRSKTAQYAVCTICEFRGEKSVKTVLDKPASGVAAYRLESDVYLSENGVPAVSAESLCRALGVDADKLRSESFVAAKTVSGYNAKRNMKNQQITVLTAGSVLVFDSPSGFVSGTSDKLNEVTYIGEKQNEGYGRVIFIPDAENDTAGNEKPAPKPANGKDSSVSALIRRNVMLEAMQKLGIEKADTIELDPSPIGRLTLMAKDADKASADKFLDFEKRLYSIKSETTRKNALAVFGEKALQKVLENSDIIFSDCSVPAGKDGSEKITLTVTDEQWQYVYKYILTALTVRKYQLRKEGKNDE